MYCRPATSLAFAAVAVAVLVDDIDAVTDELDTFLASPLVWQLENAGVAGERTGPAIRNEHFPRSGWTMSNAAMHLVLQSGAERREALRLVGEELAGRSGELVGAVTPPLAGLVPQPAEDDPDEVARLQATRWATELDISHYQAEPAGDNRVKARSRRSSTASPQTASSRPSGSSAKWKPDALRTPLAAASGRLACSCPRPLASLPPAVTSAPPLEPSWECGRPRAQRRRPVAGDGPQEQVKGTGGGLPCLLTPCERGTGDDSGEDHQEHEDARRYDQQRRPSSGQRNKDAYRRPSPRIGQPRPSRARIGGDRKPEQHKHCEQEHRKNDPGNRRRPGCSQRAPGLQWTLNHISLGHRSPLSAGVRSTASFHQTGPVTVRHDLTTPSSSG